MSDDSKTLAEEPLQPPSPAMATPPPVIKRVGAALFYCITSFSIILINKTILTVYKFPSFDVLGVGQLLTAVVVLFTVRTLKFIEFPQFSFNVIKQIWPLPLFYVGNLTFGLGGTQKLSLPMLTTLRRFSILFTLLGEYIVLGIVAPLIVKVSVGIMVGGALVAASNDLAFDALGYTFILMNNVCTAANNVYIKQKLEAKNVGKFGLIFYNSLLMLVPLALYAGVRGKFTEALNYTGWNNPTFVACVIASCFMGFILNYSVILCTYYNSALTTTIMGVIKNLSVTYIGMVFGGDYIFSWVNFTGLNLSVFGSIIYTYVTFKGPSLSTQPTQQSA